MEFRKTAPKEKLIPNPKARLQEQVREVMCFHLKELHRLLGLPQSRFRCRYVVIWRFLWLWCHFWQWHNIIGIELQFVYSQI